VLVSRCTYLASGPLRRAATSSGVTECKPVAVRADDLERHHLLLVVARVRAVRVRAVTARARLAEHAVATLGDRASTALG
jgi:hypothetical protein